MQLRKHRTLGSGAELPGGVVSDEMPAACQLGPRDADLDGRTRGSLMRLEAERPRPSEPIEHGFSEVLPQMTGMIKCFQHLLSVDPPLGQLASLV